MKKGEKRLIAVLVLITIVVIIVLVMMNRNKKKENEGEANNIARVEEFTTTLDDGTRLNTSSKLQETKRIEGVEIGGFQLTEKDNESILLGTATNTSNTTQGGYSVNITLIDKEGREIITIVGYVQTLAPGQSGQFSASATFDFANAYDFRISKYE